MPETTATIVRDMLVQMSQGKQPNFLYPNSAMSVADLAKTEWDGQPENDYGYVNLTAIDAGAGGLDLAYAGVTLLLWDWAVAEGRVTVPQIDAAVTTDPWLIPIYLIPGSVGTDIFVEFLNAMRTLPSPGVVNDDPFGAFPGLYPTSPDSWYLAAVAALNAVGITGPTQAQIDAAALAIQKVLTTAPC